MIRHFFLDKTATIYKDSMVNTGLNPIIVLNYGKGISRALLHFDEEAIKSMVEDKTIANYEKVSARLKMTNCGSFDGKAFDKTFYVGNNIEAKRASSFDLLLFRLPQVFDSGRGFDYSVDFYDKDSKSYTTHGASWFYSQDGNVWRTDSDKMDLTDPEIRFIHGQAWRISVDGEGTLIPKRIELTGGIYSDEFIAEELEKYNNGEESIIEDIQHFDYGTENLDMDVTHYLKMLVQDFNANYGLGLMFSPKIEKTKTDIQQHAGFFAAPTNTFFHPYIELIYDEPIKDNRESFYIGRENNLYLYCNIDGVPTNLDELPVCELDGVGEGNVEQVGKGVYKAVFKVSKDEVDNDTILYDKWSNLRFNGQEIDDVEMETVALSSSNFLMIGSGSRVENNLVPYIEGINDDEKLQQGEIREVVVDFRKKYTTDKKEIIDGAEYRLYVNDGNSDREVTVIDYTPLDMCFMNNCFNIYTEDLIPGDYFIDIRIKKGRETKYYKKVSRFTVVSNENNRFE